ncbi:hypothetical protein ACFVTC_19035 [Streptomyces sp. NPDC057950]
MARIPGRPVRALQLRRLPTGLQITLAGADDKLAQIDRRVP